MRTYKLKIEDKAVTVEVKTFSSSGADLIVNGTAMHVDVDGVESKAGKPVRGTQIGSFGKHPWPLRIESHSPVLLQGSSDDNH